jgi:hypothetical protein
MNNSLPKKYRDGQFTDPRKQTILDWLAFIALVIMLSCGIALAAIFAG